MGATTICIFHPAIFSIHAPAWGRHIKLSKTCYMEEFQSTPPAGGRLNNISTAISFNPRYEGLLFQSTPPRGGDASFCFAVSLIHAPAWGKNSGHILRFNPRPRVGATNVSAVKCFNPRPRVGALYRRTYSVKEFSIHAPRGGGSAKAQQEMFQSTPPRGGDLPFSR